MSRIERNNERTTLPCIALCGLIFVILGFLYIVPENAVTIVKPLFIGICIVFHAAGFYRISNFKWLALLILYYVLLFLFSDINSLTLNTFISLELFAVFFMFAACRVWSPKEIRWILVSVCIASTIQAVIILASNGGLLHASGAQQVKYLQVETNRNPVAFAITPGAVSGTIMFLPHRGKGKIMSNTLFGVCAIICAFAVLALGCRSAFISMAAGVVLVFWHYSNRSDNPQRRSRTKLLLLISIIIIAVIAANMTEGTYSERLFDVGDDLDGSGRVEIWKSVWPVVMQKPVFGHGFQFEVEGLTMGTHNSFLTVMLYSGFVGGGLLALFFLSLLYSALKTKSYLSISFWIEAFMHSMTEGSLDYYAYIPLVLAAITLLFGQSHRNGVASIFKR